MKPRRFDLARNLRVLVAAVTLLVVTGLPAFSHIQSDFAQFTNSNYVNVSSNLQEGSCMGFISVTYTLHSEHTAALQNFLGQSYSISVSIFLDVENQGTPSDNFTLTAPAHDTASTQRNLSNQFAYQSTGGYDTNAGTSVSTDVGVDVDDPHSIVIVL